MADAHPKGSPEARTTQEHRRERAPELHGTGTAQAAVATWPDYPAEAGESEGAACGRRSRGRSNPVLARYSAQPG